MKFGVREICDVVLRAKAAMKVGEKVFYKNEPVLYFDSLKTSSMEGAATTVYAQGGRGNARLIAWEGERTVTFTMEDALISPMGFSILTGAGLTSATEKPIIVHKTEQVKIDSFNSETTPTEITIKLSEEPYTLMSTAQTPAHTMDNSEDYIYVMLLDDNGEVASEPYIASEKSITQVDGKWQIKIVDDESEGKDSDDTTFLPGVSPDPATNRKNDLSKFKPDSVVLVDYYVKKSSGAFQIDITPDKFGGNFYLEASTLFRATNGVDMPAEFIIPNCKIQSNFTFTMASSGDPSTFTFTMDAFPDYTRWDPTKKVFAAIQVIEDSNTLADFERLGTGHDYGKYDATTGAILTTPTEPYKSYFDKQKDHIEKV